MAWDILHRLQRRIIRWRWQPIRVYCLHHVCSVFDAESMYACDWIRIDEFKQKVIAMLQSGVRFISLSEAHAKITNDTFRMHHYAVLTFDDGYASLKEILPWLEEQKIPATLFINGKYLDGKSYRKNPKERYLTKEELWALTSPLIEIGNHGWEHVRVTELTKEEFEKSVANNVNFLKEHPNYVPYWAYTFGSHTRATDEHLYTSGLIPVYVNGEKNYHEAIVINRELMQISEI